MSPKVIHLQSLQESENPVGFIRRSALSRGCHRLVLTNGCFDLLHLGHIKYLQQARESGDMLVVGLNGDASVRALKGPTRPIVPETERAEILAALECVDAIVIFNSPRCHEMIDLIKPEVYVKGGDYTLDKLDLGERAALERCGSKISFVPFVTDHSTTKLIERIQGDIP